MKKLLYLLAVIILPIFLSSCEENTNSGQGTLTLSITDSPVDSSGVTGVYITVSEIQIHTSNNGWETFENFEGPKTFNLLDLTRGESDLLGSFSLVNGSYTQIRFMLDAPTTETSRPVNPGCYIKFSDGSTEPLFVPSGSQSGFKATGEFNVPVNGTVNITADFDVRKSVVKTGSATPRYILKPTIRLVVDNQAGQIRGNVTNIPENTGVVVYAYEDGVYNNVEANNPVADSTRFPNAVNSDMVDSLGVYHLAYLEAGTYDLIVTSLTDNSFGEVLGIIENVSVESRKTTVKDLNIESFK